MGRHLGWEVLGVQDGYQGLLEGRIAPLEARQLDGVERRGGTILGTSRSAEFRTAMGNHRQRAGRAHALRNRGGPGHAQTIVRRNGGEVHGADGSGGAPRYKQALRGAAI